MLRSASIALLAVAAALALAGAAQAKSEFAVFAVTVQGQGQSAWLNPVGEGCLGDGQQAALRGSMREQLRFSTPRPTLVTVSGLNGNRGPMRVMPLDRRVPAVPVQAEVTRSGSVDYLDCKPGIRWNDCPELAARTRPECHAPRAVTGMEGCFGTRTFQTTLGLALTGSLATFLTGPPNAVEDGIFSCRPEDDDFRPSYLLPGSMSLRAQAPLPRRRLQRAKTGTTIVLRGADLPSRDAVTGCKAPAPATCERSTGELTVTLRFVCRARTTRQRCAGFSSKEH